MRKLLVVLCAFIATGAFAQNLQNCLQAGGNGAWGYCSSAPQPTIIQKHAAASSGSVASLTNAFASNNQAGNTIVVVFANGNNNNAASPITDTNSNTYTKAVQVANGTAFEVEIWYATGILAGANTVTVTPGGSNASIASEVYEVSGTLTLSPQILDGTNSGTATGTTISSGSVSPVAPNEFAFAGFGVGTAAQTVTVTAPFTNDSGQQNPATPAGLFSFVSVSSYLAGLPSTGAQGAIASEPWGAAIATFKTLSVPVQGTLQGLGTAGAPAGGVLSVQGVASGQPVVTNNTQLNGSAYSTAATGVQKVGVVGGAGTSLESSAGVLDHNLKNVGNSAVSTAATGVQKVGVVGNAGSAVDASAGGTAATNSVAVGGTYNTSAPGPSNGQQEPLQLDAAANLKVTILPGTTNGWTPILENGLSTTVQTVKGSAGELGAYYCWNPNGAVAYIQIFDTGGTVTLGSTAPKWSIGIPPTSAANLELANGMNFASAIKVAATTTATGSSAPSTGIDCNFAFK
jgi:hypothetical protein